MHPIIFCCFSASITDINGGTVRLDQTEFYASNNYLQRPRFSSIRRLNLVVITKVTSNQGV